jgi:steroid Delta-isomerase
MPGMPQPDLLTLHVDRFNTAIRSGDFGPMLAGFASDAEMVFEGVPVGPYLGRDAIAAAYAARPPDDEVRLVTLPRLEGETLVADYAWAADGKRAGRMLLTASGSLIQRLVVTFG